MHDRAEYRQSMDNETKQEFPVAALRDPVNPPVKGDASWVHNCGWQKTFMVNWLALNMETEQMHCSTTMKIPVFFFFGSQYRTKPIARLID